MSGIPASIGLFGGPAGAGSDCYLIPGGRLPIADQARAIFERHGITVVGEPADSYFTPDHMLDPYYHVDSAAAQIRTQKMVARLQDAGMRPGENDHKETVRLASEAMRGMPP